MSETTNIAEPLSFDERLELAHSSLVLTYERRDNFLSDDDVLDAADEWTTSEPYGDDDESDPNRDDYESLRDALFARLLQENEA